jgi:hypothetical protein
VPWPGIATSQARGKVSVRTARVQPCRKCVGHETALAAEVRFRAGHNSKANDQKDVPQELKRVCENFISKLSPAGTSELSPGR